MTNFVQNQEMVVIAGVRYIFFTMVCFLDPPSIIHALAAS